MPHNRGLRNCGKTEAVQDFEDLWIGWVRAGARRDECGKPVLPDEKKEPEPKAAPSRPLALPATKGPIELSVELDGRAFALRAPDLDGAAWIHEYAGRLLADVGRIAEKLKEETNNA